MSKIYNEITRYHHINGVRYSFRYKKYSAPKASQIYYNRSDLLFEDEEKV